MSEENKMDVLDWIPQLKSNNISIESTNTIKPSLLTTLKVEYISTQEDAFKRMVLYFRTLETNLFNIANQDMHDEGITETYLPFWYYVNDNEFILKASSQKL